MRGWLATSVCGADGNTYGLLQLSDKSAGRDFDTSDEENIRELAALIGETLDALRGGVGLRSRGSVASLWPSAFARRSARPCTPDSAGDQQPQP